MSPALKVKFMEAAAISLMAGGLSLFELCIRARVKLEASSEAWIAAASVKEPSDGISRQT